MKINKTERRLQPKCNTADIIIQQEDVCWLHIIIIIFQQHFLAHLFGEEAAEILYNCCVRAVMEIHVLRGGSLSPIHQSSAKYPIRTIGD